MSQGAGKKVFGLVMFIGLGGALCVFGWQALTWLMTSAWKPISVLTALNWLHIRWSVFPDSGSGLQLLGNTPLAAALFGLGVLGLLAFVVLD